MTDYLDLNKSTSDYVVCSNHLDTAMEKEQDALQAYGETEIKARKEYFEKLQLGEITKGLYDEKIKIDTFQTKLDLDTAKLRRRRVENKLNEFREILNTTKLNIRQ